MPISTNFPVGVKLQKFCQVFFFLCIPRNCKWSTCFQLFWTVTKLIFSGILCTYFSLFNIVCGWKFPNIYLKKKQVTVVQVIIESGTKLDKWRYKSCKLWLAISVKWCCQFCIAASVLNISPQSCTTNAVGRAVVLLKGVIALRFHLSTFVPLVLN